MVDPERLLSLLERAGEEVAHLREQAELGADPIRADRIQLDAAKYRLIVAIEACVDAADHVIASESLRRPRSFADAFTVLAEAGLLSESVAATARRMAGFRNLLVHGYAQIDDDQVVQIVLHRLDDIARLLSELAALAARS